MFKKRKHKHKWWVFGTALATGQLMLECSKCRALGLISNPSSEEWGIAFYGPSNPYRRKDNQRVEELK